MAKEFRPISRRLLLGAAIGGGGATLFFLALLFEGGLDGSGFFSAGAVLVFWAMYSAPMIAGATLAGAFAGGAFLEKAVTPKLNWVAVAAVAAAAGWLMSHVPVW